MAGNDSDVGSHVVRAVAIAHAWLTAVPTQWLASGGFPDVTPALLDLVLAIGDEGAPLVALRAQRGTSKQAVGRLVGEAERRGYVILDADATDGRSKFVRLTATGLSLLEERREAMRRLSRVVSETLGLTVASEVAGRLVALAGAMTDPDAGSLAPVLPVDPLNGGTAARGDAGAPGHLVPSPSLSLHSRSLT